MEELIGLEEEQRFIDSVKQTVRERKATGTAYEGPLQLPDEVQVAEMVAMLKARYGIG
ncbi:hypothetical protein D3C87_2071530 [compost metagenome]